LFFILIVSLENGNGLGAIAAVAHDVIFVLGIIIVLQIYAFGMEIDQHFIAAILTVGYSMNDTIVFDRVREFLMVKGNF
jgi:SecD/SecF fusion protein